MAEKAQKKEGGGPALSFLEHLSDLRKHLWRGTLLMAVMVAVAFFFRGHVMRALVQPLMTAWDGVKGLPGKPTLNYANPVDPFMVDLKIALLTGLLLGLPFLLWQLWLFVAPGLYKKERRYAYPLLFFGYFFFISGALFCYYVMLPIAFKFLLIYARDMGGGLALSPVIMIKDYAGLALKLMLGFGLTFELPVVIVILTLVGLVNWRWLLKMSRYFLVLAFVVSAILTPTTDIFSQLLMAGPLILLYYLSVLVSFFLRPGEKKTKPKAAIEKKAEP